MDRTAWLTIVILWAACACKLSDALGGCIGHPCTDDAECKPNQVCGDGICRKCICEPNGTCFWNSTSYRTECDCDDGYHGRVCDCKDTGCGCPDIYSFGAGCSSYASDFEDFPGKGIHFGTLVSPSNVPTNKYKVNDESECKAKCTLHGCNVFEYRNNIAGLLPNCKVYQVGNLVDDYASIVNKILEWSLFIKKCLTCTL